MPLKDFKCGKCGNVTERLVDTSVSELDCECGGKLQTCFDTWESVNFQKPFSRSMYNATGTAINSFGLEHDPVCKAEIGLIDRNTTILPTEEREDFGRRYMREGDSPELRNDIIKRRKDIITKKKSKRFKAES